MGCSGGWLWAAWGYLQSSGACTEECFPYTAGSGVAPPCQSTCDDGSPKTTFKAADKYDFGGSDDEVKKIMADIKANGPMETGFTVYSDFMNYKGGIY